MNDDNHKTLQEFAMGEIIKELRAERDALKAENESLNAKNASLKAEIDYPESILLEEPFCWYMWNPNERDGLNEGFVQFCEQNPASEKPDWKGHIWKAIKLYASPVPAQQSAEVTPQYPMQPIFLDKGLPRFEKNPIVDWLCEKSGLNEIGIWWQVNKVEQKYIEQLYQLIGYSIRGYEELSEVSDASFDRAQAMAEQLLKGGENER